MSLATKATPSRQQAPGRVWRTPTSPAWWLWLVLSIILYAIIFVLYLRALQTQAFPGPFNDPLRSFGILAFVLVLGTATYSLRRRFIRGLPGKAQAWLWMHIWLGITAVLIALLHENFAHILHAYCQNASCFTNADWGTSALFALIFLVLSGIVGRLLDVWQTHVISREANTNGVGIVQALDERILELEYTIERLSAGKSEAFKQYCLQGLEAGARYLPSDRLSVARSDSFVAGRNKGLIAPASRPNLAPHEQADFQRADETLTAHTHLVQSLERQRRARLIIRTWRYVHIVLACLALLIITYHAVMELLTNVLHILKV